MYDNAAFRSPFGNYDTLAKAVTNLLSPKELLFLHINSNARVVSAVTEKQHGAWMPRSSQELTSNKFYSLFLSHKTALLFIKQLFILIFYVFIDWTKIY